MRQGSPHFLAVDYEVVAAILSPRRQRGHVGTGARLGISLAPYFVSGEDRTQIATFLFVRPPLHDRGSCDIQPDRIDRSWRTDPIHFFIVNVLFDQRGAAPAVLPRPVNADPAGIE